MENNINELLDLSNRKLEQMSIEEKKKYYEALREYCSNLKKYSTKVTLVQKILAKTSANSRPFDLEILGKDNLVHDGALIMANHSNSHDPFVSIEALNSAHLPATFLASEEGLNKFYITLLKLDRATIINRFDKNVTKNGFYDFTSKLLNGDTCVIFGEGTWNMHPFKPMQNIKIGGAKSAAIARKPIIPTIYEYVEVPKIVKEEKDLYSKVVVKFGKPIEIDESKSLIEQTMMVQNEMVRMRKELWRELGTDRNCIEDVNPYIYINHTWLKKYGSLEIGVDSEREQKVLLSLDGKPVENEYYYDENGNFAPGFVPQKTLHKGF